MGIQDGSNWWYLVIGSRWWWFLMLMSCFIGRSYRQHSTWKVKRQLTCMMALPTGSELSLTITIILHLLRIFFIFIIEPSNSFSFLNRNFEYIITICLLYIKYILYSITSTDFNCRSDASCTSIFCKASLNCVCFCSFSASTSTPLHIHATQASSLFDSTWQHNLKNPKVCKDTFKMASIYLG